jgi:hypothetical protein
MLRRAAATLDVEMLSLLISNAIENFVLRVAEIEGRLGALQHVDDQLRDRRILNLDPVHTKWVRGQEPNQATRSLYAAGLAGRGIPRRIRWLVWTIRSRADTVLVTIELCLGLLKRCFDCVARLSEAFENG